MRVAGSRSGPELSEPARQALHTLGEYLLGTLEHLADRLTLVVLQREPSYAQLGGAAPDELRANLRSNLESGLLSLANQIPEDQDPQRAPRATGRLRARQRVPLEAVLRAYQLGGRVIWEGLLAASRDRFGGEYDQALLDGAGHVWRLIDSGSAALVDAYRLEETRLHSQEMSKRGAFLNALLDGWGSDEKLTSDAAAALGIPVSGPMMCVVAPVDTPRDDPLRSPHDVLAAHGMVSTWHLRPTDMVGLVLLGDRSPETALAALSPAIAGRVGASPVVHHLAEVHDAYGLARTAARTLPGPGVALLDERLPEALLADSPRLAGRLRQVAFGGLLRLPEPEQRLLLETLGAVIDSGWSPTHAARRLYCHRNTVIYRLQRIEAASGRTLSEPRDRLLLSLATLAAAESG